jgi:hypothetical protein
VSCRRPGGHAVSRRHPARTPAYPFRSHGKCCTMMIGSVPASPLLPTPPEGSVDQTRLIGIDLDRVHTEAKRPAADLL